MGIEAIGVGLKTNIDTISGLRVYAPNELPDTLNELPTCLILPGEAEYHADFDNDFDYMLRAVIVIAKQDSPSAFNKILDYIEATGSSSVKAAVEADRTLDGSAADVRVNRNLGIGALVWGGITYLSTEFEIAIWSK